MARQDDLNSVFVNDFTELKTKLTVMSDVLNVMDWAIDSTLEQLEEAGSLDPEVGLLVEYRKAIKTLRKQGFSKPKQAGMPAVACPSCKANLSNVAGAPGDTCSWCGHTFE